MLISAAAVAVNAFQSQLASHGHNAIANTTFTNTIRLLFDVGGNQVDVCGAKVNYFMTLTTFMAIVSRLEG